MTDLFVMDKNFEILAVIDDFISLTWNPRFFGVGDWQLECGIKYFDVLQQAKYIGRNDDTETGVVELGTLQKDEIGAKNVLIKGHFIKQLLDTRAVHEQMNFTDKTVEDVILSMIEEHFIKNKKFERFEVKRTGEVTEKLTTQITGGSVLERIAKIEEEQEVSCVVEYDPIKDKIFCSVKKGVNHSQDQQENDWVIFSEEFENIYDYEYTKVRQTKNFAYVAGAGEGKNRIIKTVDIRKSGEPLQELYVDARDLQDTDDNGNTIPRDRYIKNLEQRGKEKLSEYAEIQEIEAKVKTDGLLQYKKHYSLGDFVDFVDQSRGIYATLRVIGVNEEIEEGEHRMELIFGKERLNLKDTIKREVAQ